MVAAPDGETRHGDCSALHLHLFDEERRVRGKSAATAGAMSPLAGLIAEASVEAPVDQERIRCVKQALAEGTLSIVPTRIAARLIELQLGRAEDRQP